MLIMGALPLVFLLLAIGCSDEASPTFPDRDPAIVGRIVARDVPISISQQGTTVHVKESAEEMCGIIFAVGPETPIMRRTRDGSLREADVHDLVSDLRVAVWTTLILDSCPGQAVAEAIEISRPDARDLNAMLR